MKHFFNSKIKWHVGAIILFFVLTAAYFHPVYKGKTIDMGDLRNAAGMRQEIVKYEKIIGRLALWTNSMFSGMPAYQIYMKYKYNWPNSLRLTINEIFNYPVDVVFMAMIGFYILLTALGMHPVLAIIGSFAYAFGSYFFIVIEAGHTSKTFAMAFMPWVMAGMAHLYQKRIFIGTLWLLIGTALEIASNHVQITYYLGFVLLAYGLSELYFHFKSGEIKKFTLQSLWAIFLALVCVLPNATNLLLTKEYGEYTTRGKSELTKNNEVKTSGLDKDYAMQWSYGINETFSLLVPNVVGGGSGMIAQNHRHVLDKVDPPQYRQYIGQMDQYWGDQPFTSGPVYVGAIIVLLFFTGLVVVPKRFTIWIVAVSVFAMMLAWGKNFPAFNEWMLDHFPLYNKFRAVSMTLVIVELTFPLMAMLALHQIMTNHTRWAEGKNFKRLLYAGLVAPGICVVMWLMPSIFTDFFKTGEYENLSQMLVNAGLPQSEVPIFLEGLKTARMEIFKSDVLRSLFYSATALIIILMFLKKKINQTVTLSVIGILVLVDMWSINQRYLNKDDFVSKKIYDQPFPMTQVDAEILQDTTLHYRVFNLAVNTFNDASTSYYHRSIGGYHGAKLKRYQELIEYHLSKQNKKVVNMLNTRYYIVPDNQRQPKAVRNPEALGNAWMVSDVHWVKNADEEIDALNNFDPAVTAIIDERFKSFKPVAGKPQESDFIRLVYYAPDSLVYRFQSNTDQLVVFSEIYYDKGWKAYIDGKPADYFRANYVLRSMNVPAGDHTIVFEFKPDTYYLGEKISMFGSILWFVMILGTLFMMYKKDWVHEGGRD